MRSFLKAHRRTKSAGIDALDSDWTSNDWLQPIQTNGFSSPPALKKLNPMVYFRRASGGSFDSKRHSMCSIPVSIEEYRQAGIIYGTKTHDWGGSSSGTRCSPSPVSSPMSSLTSVASFDSLKSCISVVEEVAEEEELLREGQLHKQEELLREEGVLKEQRIEDTDEQDSKSIFSFQDPDEIGRNSSVNYYRKESPIGMSRQFIEDFFDSDEDGLDEELNVDDMGPIRPTSPLRIVKSPIVYGDHETFDPPSHADDESYSDNDYDSLLDEVNALAEEYYEDEYNMVSRCHRRAEPTLQFADSPLPSLMRCNSSVIKTKETIITVFLRSKSLSSKPSRSGSEKSSLGSIANLLDCSGHVNDDLPLPERYFDHDLGQSLTPISERSFDGEILVDAISI
jgi:hypothetical protein